MRITWLVLLSVLAPLAQGDEPVGRPYSLQAQLPPADVRLSLPAMDAPARRAELASKPARVGPEPFADPVDTRLPLDQWQLIELDGGRLWRARVQLPGATDLNFGFQGFALPPGASLYLVGNHPGAGQHFAGPYGAEHNRPHGQLWTPVVPGGDVTLELFVPDHQPDPSSLTLTRVGGGFLDAFELFGGPGFKGIGPGSCNNDVVCPEGDQWRDQIRSVARYTIDGSGLCTGSMVMDTAASFKPLFLTAFHCGVNAGNAATVVTYWNFESPNCGDLSGGSLDQSLSGSNFLAGRQDVDSTLVELSSAPPDSYGVYWSGWDRSDTTPLGSVGIHHPGGHEKMISINDDSLDTTNSCIQTNPTQTHWLVDDWEDGTTEPGSSGSGLWDSDSKLIVGFLSGGTAVCPDNNGFDCYGKLSVAWSGGANDTQRLGPWLDPGNTGLTSVDGGEPETDPLCSGPGLAIPDASLGGVSDDLVVSAAGSVVDLDAVLQINHSFVGDLSAELTRVGSGVTVDLLDRPGRPASTLGCGNENVDVLLDDGATSAAEDACAATPPAISGTLTPSQPLAAFNGQPLAGTWRLTVSDAVAQDTGTLLQWCLRPTLDIADDFMFADGFE